MTTEAPALRQKQNGKAVPEIYAATYFNIPDNFTRILKFKAVSWTRALAAANMNSLPGEKLQRIELA